MTTPLGALGPSGPPVTSPPHPVRPLGPTVARSQGLYTESAAFDRAKLLHDAARETGVDALLPSVVVLVGLMSVQTRQRLTAEIARTLSGDDLLLRVEKTPDVVGGRACIVRTRIPVWLLEARRRDGWTDDELLANYPTLRKADLTSAWLYAEARPEEIAADLDANRE